MKFNNTPNPCYDIELLGGKIWIHRAVAITFVLTVIDSKTNKEFFLISKRGSGTPDFQGYWNLVCGYLDWDENGTDACNREFWEETGIDLESLLKNSSVTYSSMLQPFHVHSDIDANKQNVTLRYGTCIRVPDINKFIEENECTNENSEPNEVSDYKWITIDEISNYKFAFGHDQVIIDFFNLLKYSCINYE